MMLEPMGLAAGPWCRRASGVSSTSRSMRCRGCDSSVLHRAFREFEAGRPIVGSAPVGVDGTASAKASARLQRAPSHRGGEAVPPGHSGRPAASPIKGRITLSARVRSSRRRLLVESGADSLRGHGLPRTPTRPTLSGGQGRHAVPRLARGGLVAVDAFEPDLAIGTTLVAQHAKERDSLALLHQSQPSRLLMGPAEGVFAQVVNAAMGNRDRMDTLPNSSTASAPQTAGVWSGAEAARRPARRQGRRAGGGFGRPGPGRGGAKLAQEVDRCSSSITIALAATGVPSTYSPR